MNHREVVKVTYDTNILNESQLEAYAKRNSFRPVDPNKTYSVASGDVHYYMRHTDFKYLPLTPLQQTKINSALGSRSNPQKYLSPKQRTWLKEIQASSLKSKNLMHTDFETAWSFKEQENPISLSSTN